MNMTGGVPQTGFLQGIAPEHVAALYVLLSLLPALRLFARVLRVAAGSGWPLAEALQHGFEASSRLTRLTSALLFATGAIHLTLVPAHRVEEPLLALLLLLYGLACLLLAVLCFVWRDWRAAAVLLLAAGVISYITAIAGRTEAPDQVGMLTKLIELTALGLVLLPELSPGARRSTVRYGLVMFTVLTLAVLTGSVSWAASFRTARTDRARQSDQEMRINTTPGMVMQAVSAGPPTAAQQLAADRFVTETRAGITRYQDLYAAIADGYRPASPPNGATVHYMNPAAIRAHHVLDPKQPEELVYANTIHGPVLLGAMYVMPRSGQRGPDFGGALSDWHVHTNLCVAIGSWQVVGFLSPFATCPAGSLNVVSSAMLHVWTINNPTGAYGDLDPTWLKRLIHGELKQD